MILDIAEAAARFTTKTQVDDNAVKFLRAFFESNPQLAPNLFGVMTEGFKNGFDLNDEAWVKKALGLLFDIIETHFEN